LYDPGTYPAKPICRKITWRVTRPETEPKDEEERKQVKRLKEIMAKIKKELEEKQQLD